MIHSSLISYDILYLIVLRITYALSNQSLAVIASTIHCVISVCRRSTSLTSAFVMAGHQAVAQHMTSVPGPTPIVRGVVIISSPSTLTEHARALAPDGPNNLMRIITRVPRGTL